jgi:hypothetical protein
MQVGSFWSTWLPFGFQTRASNARWASVCLLVWLLAGLVAGCGVSTATRASASGITSFHIVRTSAFPSNHIPPFERTVVDARQAVKVYTALQALPVFPKGVMNCPADFGVAYHLTFFRGQSSTSWARVNPGGCEGVQLADGSVRWAATSKAFWQTLADAVGVPVSTLFVVPGDNGASSAGEGSAAITPSVPRSYHLESNTQ